MANLMRLLAVKTRRRDRISADEEERQRAGHEIVTTIRFVPHGERAGQLTSTDHRRRTRARHLTYGDTALIRRMNVGLRRRKDKDVRGLPARHRGRALVHKRQTWPRTCTARPRGIQRVVPYVEDHRNALLCIWTHRSLRISGWPRCTRSNAASRRVFQLESTELAVEPLPGTHRRPRLVAAAVLRSRRGRRRRAAPPRHRRRPATSGRAKSAGDPALRPRHRRGPRHRAPHAHRGLRTGLLRLPAVLQQPVGPPAPRPPPRHRPAPTTCQHPTWRSEPAARTERAQLERLTKASNSELEKQFLDVLERARLPAARRCPAARRRLLRPAGLRLPHRRHGRRDLHRRPGPRHRTSAGEGRAGPHEARRRGGLAGAAVPLRRRRRRSWLHDHRRHTPACSATGERASA